MIEEIKDIKFYCVGCKCMKECIISGGDICCVKCCLVISSYEENKQKEPEKKGFQKGLYGKCWNDHEISIGEYIEGDMLGQYSHNVLVDGKSLYFKNFEPLPCQWIKHDGSDKCPIDDEIWNDESVYDIYCTDRNGRQIMCDRRYFSSWNNVTHYMIIELPKRDTK